MNGSIVDTAAPAVLALFPSVAGVTSAAQLARVLDARQARAAHEVTLARVTPSTKPAIVRHINGKVEGINSADFAGFADYLAYLEANVMEAASAGVKFSAMAVYSD